MTFFKTKKEIVQKKKKFKKKEIFQKKNEIFQKKNRNFYYGYIWSCNYCVTTITLSRTVIEMQNKAADIVWNNKLLGDTERTIINETIGPLIKHCTNTLLPVRVVHRFSFFAVYTPRVSGPKNCNLRGIGPISFIFLYVM